MNTQQLERRYTPAVGKRVKLRLWEHYTTLVATSTVVVWSWFVVRAVDGEQVSIEHVNGLTETGEVFTVPLAHIEPPIGWAPTYTIHAKPEQARKIISEWFTRGIVVRQSHDLGCAGDRAFQPLDNSEQPHWRFPELTDAIQPEDCPHVFSVVSVEEEEINFVTDPRCTRCNGTGRDTVARVAKVRNVEPEDLAQDRKFTENLEDFTGKDFACSCIYGGFRQLTPKERNQLIKTWKREGWHTEYIRHAGGFWIRRRETLLHKAL